MDFPNDRVTTETFRLTIRNKHEALYDLLEEGNMDIDTQLGDVEQHMQRSSGKEEIAKKLDFCRHCQQSAIEEGNERCN